MNCYGIQSNACSRLDKEEFGIYLSQEGEHFNLKFKVYIIYFLKRGSRTAIFGNTYLLKKWKYYQATQSFIMINHEKPPAKYRKLICKVLKLAGTVIGHKQFFSEFLLIFGIKSTFNVKNVFN